jgi:hypothetical protein
MSDHITKWALPQVRPEICMVVIWYGPRNGIASFGNPYFIGGILFNACMVG